MLAKAMADRKDLPERYVGCRATAATAIGILKLATGAWLAGDEISPEPYGRAAFAALRAVAR